MQLRDYQQSLHDNILAAWAQGYRAVMAQLPTGGGKTVTFSHVVREENGPAVVMAHRRELVLQMSVALAREGVRHRVFGPAKLLKLCARKHLQKVGRNYTDQNSFTAVASVQTLAAMKTPPPYFSNVSLVVGDEGHHYLAKNEFGRAVGIFPKHARVLLVTATPGRADGKGLGSHADGIADVLVRGPEPYELIQRGYLSKYRIFAPPNDLDRAHIPVSADGDFQKGALKEATKKSHVLGDVVQHYVQFASGKLGLTFADSIENAADIASRYRAAGVAAEMLSGKTPDDVRDNVLSRFERREIMQIVSVALIDEGFDCPAVEVVSDAAATESFNRFAQRFGRGLRIMEGKTHMIYFDHVGNVERHGLPDAPRVWSLDRRERRSAGTPNDVIPVRVCVGCTSVYERYLTQCPHCGWRHEPSGRSTPEQVDGVLSELDPEVLARMRGEVAALDGAYEPTPGLSAAAQGANRKHHWERQEAQKALRAAMATWGGWKTHEGRTDPEAQALFFYRYGMSVIDAWALPRADAETLRSRIERDLLAGNVRSKT